MHAAHAAAAAAPRLRTFGLHFSCNFSHRALVSSITQTILRARSYCVARGALWGRVVCGRAPDGDACCRRDALLAGARVRFRAASMAPQ